MERAEEIEQGASQKESEEWAGGGRVGPGYSEIGNVEEGGPKISRINRRRRETAREQGIKTLGKSTPKRTGRQTRKGVGHGKETGKMTGGETHKKEKVDGRLGQSEKSEGNTSVHTAKRNHRVQVEAGTPGGKTGLCRLEGETARAQAGPGQRLVVGPS